MYFVLNDLEMIGSQILTIIDCDLFLGNLL